ncbi:hypothetical protein GQX74_002776 [Glossina fuscipes]|nr:hypothetical protein GQX74_002776 [Glossina fuscipes]
MHKICRNVAASPLLAIVDAFACMYEMFILITILTSINMKYLKKNVSFKSRQSNTNAFWTKIPGKFQIKSFSMKIVLKSVVEGISKLERTEVSSMDNNPIGEEK